MISWVIPCWNEEKLLPYCIASIIAEAKRARRPYEIIVVDNNSTDDTNKIAKELGVKVVFEPNKGLTKARQAGFEASQYDIVACIDADNMLPEGWLDYVFEALDDPRVVAVSGPVVYPELNLFKRIITALFYTTACFFHLFMPMLQGGNFVLKRSALIQIGGFDTEIAFYGEDTNIAKRLSKVGKIVLDMNMYVYTSARRMREEGMINTGLRYILNYVWIWIFDRPYTIKYKDHRPN